MQLFETVVVDLLLFLACENLTSVQESDEWVCLKPQEMVNAPEMLRVLGEITFVEKFLFENTRFADNTTTSSVDALAKQYVQSWQVDENHFDQFWDCENLRGRRD